MLPQLMAASHHPCARCCAAHKARLAVRETPAPAALADAVAADAAASAAAAADSATIAENLRPRCH